MNQHLDEIFQGEDCLTAVIYCPPFLGVRLYHALAPEQGLITFLEKAESLLHQPLSVWPERRLGDKLHSVPSAQLLHPTATKLPPLVSNDFKGQPGRRPLLGHDSDIMPPTPLHLISAGVFQAAHHSQLVAAFPRPYPSNELGCTVNSQVDVGPEGFTIRRAQVDVGLGGVHLEAAGGGAPLRRRAEGGLAVALVVGQAIPGNDFSG